MFVVVEWIICWIAFWKKIRNKANKNHAKVEYLYFYLCLVYRLLTWPWSALQTAKQFVVRNARQHSFHLIVNSVETLDWFEWFRDLPKCYTFEFGSSSQMITTAIQTIMNIWRTTQMLFPMTSTFDIDISRTMSTEK